VCSINSVKALKMVHKTVQNHNKMLKNNQIARMSSKRKPQQYLEVFDVFCKSTLVYLQKSAGLHGRCNQLSLLLLPLVLFYCLIFPKPLQARLNLHNTTFQHFCSRYFGRLDAQFRCKNVQLRKDNFFQSTANTTINTQLQYIASLQCFDTVSWATGRTFSL